MNPRDVPYRRRRPLVRPRPTSKNVTLTLPLTPAICCVPDHPDLKSCRRIWKRRQRNPCSSFRRRAATAMTLLFLLLTLLSSSHIVHASPNNPSGSSPRASSPKQGNQRKTSEHRDGDQKGPGDGNSSNNTPSSDSVSAVVICSVDGTVFTLDPWSGALRGIFASGPALVSTSTDDGSKGAASDKRKTSNSSDREGGVDDDDEEEEEDEGDVNDLFEWDDTDGEEYSSGEEEEEKEEESRNSNHEAASDRERIIPGLDGSLYSLLPSLTADASTGLRLERLPISVADVVESPISTCNDNSGNGEECSVVMGEKQTKIFRLDPATGRVVWMQRPAGKSSGFTAADSGMLPAGTSAGQCRDYDDEDGCYEYMDDADASQGSSQDREGLSPSVLLQREDYLLRSVDAVTGEERWNVTLGHFSALDFGGDGSETSEDSIPNDRYSGRAGTRVTTVSSRQKSEQPNQVPMPQLPHRLIDIDSHSTGSDASEDQENREEGYMLDLVPLPSVAFGDEGTTIIAIDPNSGKILWQKELDSVVAAVYGVEQHGPGRHIGGWISLDVIDDFELNGNGSGAGPQLVDGKGKNMLPPPHADLPPIERLTHSTMFDSFDSETQLSPPSASPDTQLSLRNDGLSNALSPYGYGHGALSGAAVISDPLSPVPGMSPIVQHARVGMQSSTLFVASISSTHSSLHGPSLPFIVEDVCDGDEGEAISDGASTTATSTHASLDTTETINIESLLLEHGLLPADATPADLQTYGALYSSLLETMKHTHRTNHGLFLSWRIVAIMICAVLGVVLGIRVGFNRQKEIWASQQQQLQSPMMNGLQSPLMNGLQSPMMNNTYHGETIAQTPSRSRSDSQQSPFNPVPLNHVDSVPPLTEFQLPPHGRPQRSPVLRSLSMPTMNSSDRKKFDIIDDPFKENTVDVKVLSQTPTIPLLRAATVATATTAAGTTPAPSISNAQPKPSPKASSGAAEDVTSSKSSSIDNLDGIPLVRYSRYSSEFRELSALGRGGFGTVFRCTNALDGRLYAIKKIRIKTQVGMDGSVGIHFKEKLHRVLREVKILALLDHPNIVRYYTAWLELEEDNEKNEDGSHLFPDQSLARCYSSDLLTGASPSVSMSSTLGPMQQMKGSKASPYRKKQLLSANPLGWNNFSGAFDRNSSIFETSEEGDGSSNPRRQNLSRGESDDDLGFTWERSASGLSLDGSLRRNKPPLLGTRMTSDLSVVGDNDEEDRSISDSSKNSSSDGSSSNSLLSEIDEDAHSVERKTNEAQTGPSQVRENDAAIISSMEIASKEGKQEEYLRNQKHILYIQMQLCTQKTLADFLSNPQARRGESSTDAKEDEKKIIGGIDLPHALHLFIQIARGVKHVHKQGLIHRDLKPMNCFIDEAGNVKIGDFGLSRESANTDDGDAEAQVDDLSTSHHDRRASLGAGEDNTVGVGTRSYASPEQMSGSDYDASTDIYSLGIILFELCYPMYTGMERHLVFRGLRQRSFPEQWTKTVAKKFPPLQEMLMEMLSPRPEDRPTSEAVVNRVDTMLGEYTCDLLGLDFEMYQKLRQLDRATAESGRQRSSSIGGINSVEEKELARNLHDL